MFANRDLHSERNKNDAYFNFSVYENIILYGNNNSIKSTNESCIFGRFKKSSISAFNIICYLLQYNIKIIRCSKRVSG